MPDLVFKTSIPGVRIVIPAAQADDAFQLAAIRRHAELVADAISRGDVARFIPRESILAPKVPNK